MISSASLQIPLQDSPGGPRPVSAAVQQIQPVPSSSRRQQRASHTVVTQSQAHHHGGSSRDDTSPFTDVYSHPAAVAYATAHPRRTIPKFGPYLLLQTLGEGEFGKVKLGLHCQWGEEVAVKLIRRGNVDNSVRMSKVEREIEVLRTLKHPNIVRLYDVIETDKYIGIILEYASGGELFDHILAHRYLRERDAAKLFSQLISGVWYIHQKKIVHRDLKLENLLLDRQRNVIITDFGFANRFEHRADDLMQTSCGSPCYAAPELVISEGLYVGSAVDIWSCGVILYAMLAGYLPFDDDPANPDGDNINLLYKYIINTPLSFPEYISNEARNLLGMMLVPDPKQRSSLEAVMQHPWLAAYASPKDSVLSAPGVLTAFGRSVEQLERTALDQHQQRRLAYQRQMRAAAVQAAQQQPSPAAPVGRSQSHQLQTGGSGHRQAATESTATGGKSQSTQPEFFYDSSVDLSVQTTAIPSPPPSASRKPMPVLGGDDDPFGPPPSSAGKATLLAAEASSSPKGHKTSGSAGGGFRHTIQVEYDSEPRGHGRSPSHGQRRSEDRDGNGIAVPEQQQPQQELLPQQQQQVPNGVPVLSPVPKERRASQGIVGIPTPTKPLPTTPTAASANGTPPASSTPSSARAVNSPSPASHKTASTTPSRATRHSRTPSTPVVPNSLIPSIPNTPTQVTPNISVDVASSPGSPIAFTTPASAADDGRSAVNKSKGRTSFDKFGKIFGAGNSAPSSTSTTTAESSSVRVPSDSGRSASSVLLSPSSTKEKEKEAKEKEGKKSRRNTLTVIVEPFRSTIRNRSAKSRQASSTEPASAVTTNSPAPNGKEKEKSEKGSKNPQPPHSAIVSSGTAKPTPTMDDTSFNNDMGIEGGAGMQASTNKARKVMAWFRRGSKSQEDEPEPNTNAASQYATAAPPPLPEKRRENTLPVQVVVTTPTASSYRVPPVPQHHAQRTPSTATAGTPITPAPTMTPSLVSRFRNSVTIGGRDRSRDRTNSAAQQHQPPQNQHPWAVLRTHHGAMDNSTVTTRPPPEVIKHLREILEGMGVEIQVESEYKYRCVRVKRRKGSMVMGGASTPPTSTTLGSVGGSNLAAVTMVGSAASNGVDKRGLPVPSPSSFSAPGGMLRGLLMRRQSSQVSSSGLTSPLDDDISSPLSTEPSIILGTAIYGDPAQDAGDEVKFSVELTRIDRINDMFCVEIRRLKGNLRSYKFLYDTIRGRLDLKR